MIADLEGLNRSTERDFLVVGGKLREFLTSARKVSADLVELAGLISGEKSRQASEALQRVRERAAAMGTRMEQSAQALQTIQGHSSKVRQSFSKLEETVSIFRTLCTLTRVETARLGEHAASFSDLAEQVKPLSEKIQASGERVLASSSDLERSVKDALKNGSELSTKELVELQALIGNVVDGLQSFEERRLRAGEASNLQAVQLRGVCESIEELVESIQFHDITRQQVEHVCEALRQIHSEAHESARADSLAPADVRGVLTLQSSQLAAAEQAFRTSVQRMASGLDDISSRVGEMAEASQTLMNLSNGEKDSFFLRMEACFSGILNALGGCFTAEATLRSTASGLEETIHGMEEAVHDIRGIEIQIQRTAINATIGSAHIGAAGNALNVIADQMHHLALDSDGNTDGVAEALRAMTEAADQVVTGSGTTDSGSAGEGDNATKEMRKALEELNASNERSFVRVNEIATLSSALREDVRSVHDVLAVGELFAGVVGRAQNELGRIGAEAHPNHPAAVPVISAQHMERFAHHYTMESERNVHRKITEGENNTALEPALAGAGATASDFGDNVELF